MRKKTPSYRQRKGYDQAIVTLTDAATKERRDSWFGPLGTPESREAYHRLIARLEARDRALPPLLDPGAVGPKGSPSSESVAEY